MKTIDFDKKIIDLKEQFTKDVPKASAPPKLVINKEKLAVVIRIISNELLKDPVIISLMSVKNSPSPQGVESFIATVRERIDHATARRYGEMFDQVFVEEKKNDQTV